MKIVLIIPYFGDVKSYFHFWYESAIINQDVDFLIFTDNDIIKRCHSASNIRVVETSFNKIKELAQEKMRPYVGEIPLSLESPYKLCDYKPFYGLIFFDFLHQYDFWGHCDVDLIFGRIRHFISDDILNRYDRIYSRGHLSIYRNVPPVNTFFLKSVNNNYNVPDYRIVLTSSKNYAFDEWGGMSTIWRGLAKDRFYDRIDFDDIFVLRKHFISYQKRNIDMNKSNFIFEFNNGMLCRWCLNNAQLERGETLYVHFQKRNMDIETDDMSRYLVVPAKLLNLLIINEISYNFSC